MDCGKRAYESQGMAEVILDEMISKGVEDANLLSTYQCEDCEMWHFTSNQNYKK
jgi:hypothetical protein